MYVCKKHSFVLISIALGRRERHFALIWAEGTDTRQKNVYRLISGWISCPSARAARPRLSQAGFLEEQGRAEAGGSERAVRARRSGETEPDSVDVDDVIEQGPEEDVREHRLRGKGARGRGRWAEKCARARGY